jgi:hypothetical protein
LDALRSAAESHARALLRRGFGDALSLSVRIFIRIALMAATVTLASACARALQLPPQATYSEIAPSGRAAKSPDCDMPVLRHLPLTEYREVGLVEATGSVYATEDQVLPTVKRKACESGADAIVILTSKSQTSEGLVGYYIDAEAIIYGKNPNIPLGNPMTH